MYGLLHYEVGGADNCNGSQLDNKEQIYLFEKTKFAREQRLRLRIIGSIGEWGYLELTLSLFSAPARQDRKR